MLEKDERVQRLEVEVSDLRVSNAALDTSVEQLAVAVRDLTETVQILRDTLNQGRGALWLALLAGGGAGALFIGIFRKLFP